MNLHLNVMKRTVAWSCLLLLGLLAGGCETPGGGASAQKTVLPAASPGMSAQVRTNVDGTTWSLGGTAVSPGTSTQAGMNEGDASIDLIHVGDRLTVNYADAPNPPQAMEQRVREDGKITLAYDNEVVAAGKQAGDLEKEIRALFVPKYFVRLTVSVKPEGRFIYVGGQVRKPDRFPYEGNMTVLKAIKIAGDFTDYANKRKVTLTRADKTKITIDCIKAQKNAKLDLRVFPGDEINVIQRHF